MPNPRVLYVGMKHDYGKPELGFSPEHYYHFDTMHNMGLDVIYFDFLTLIAKHGKAGLNRLLLDVVKREKPDFMFTVLYMDEFEKRTLRKITDDSGTITYNFFTDDHWRFKPYSQHWCKCFRWISTTSKPAVQRYHDIGMHNVIRTQWASGHFMFRRIDVPLEFDVTFIGQPHGERRRVVEAIRSAGIKVECWGRGWERGKATWDDMIRVFNSSRINLNLSASAVPEPTDLQIWRERLAKQLDRVGLRAPIRAALKKLRPPKAVAAQAAPPPPPTGKPDPNALPPQIKGRVFEVPGSNGFLLTDKAEDVDEYYKVGEEIAVFSDTDDLIAKIRHYLANEPERAAMCERAYQRTIREHTYAHRHAEIFKAVGLSVDWQLNPVSLTPRPGRVLDIT